MSNSDISIIVHGGNDLNWIRRMFLRNMYIRDPPVDYSNAKVIISIHRSFHIYKIPIKRGRNIAIRGGNSHKDIKIVNRVAFAVNYSEFSL